MKIIVLVLPLVVIACNSANTGELKSHPDTIQQKASAMYKPGLGEFMSGIQVHHAKLWFAGINENWKLADFEIHEIGEALEDIQQFNSDRPEVKSIHMIDAPIDSINASIQKQDLNSFKRNFVLLTTTCNNCHKETDHGFNVIKVPDAPPYSNQDFKTKQ